jgi:hypothetical protein
MSISPFSTRPASPESESRRTRLALAIAAVGICATLLAYALSPGVRHAVGHAAHSVNHAVGNVLDRDRDKRARSKQPAKPTHAKQRTGPTASSRPALRTTGASRQTQTSAPR